MKKYILRLVLLSIIITFGFYTYNYYQQKVASSKQALEWGVLDSVGTFNKNKNITINHIFSVWSKDGTSEIKKSIDSIPTDVDRDLIITLEPWPQFQETGKEMYVGILNRRYDEIITDTCKYMQEKTDSKKTLYLRIGHEVDLYDNSRYPWAIDDTEGFITAYRYIISKCRQVAPKIKYIWSPSGTEKSDKFYPGDEWVDYTSVSLFGYPEYDLLKSGKELNFIDLFYPKYQVMLKYNKPIFISEVGVSGTNAYKLRWLTLAKDTVNDRERFPLVKAFIYFNAKDNIAWDPTLQPPDFTIQPFIYP